MELTGRQKLQRWWLEQRKSDLYDTRKKITEEIEKINRALAAAPSTPAQCYDVVGKYNLPQIALAEVDSTETF